MRRNMKFFKLQYMDFQTAVQAEKQYKVNFPIVVEFLVANNLSLGVPRSIRLDQARSLIDNQLKAFCTCNDLTILRFLLIIIAL